MKLTVLCLISLLVIGCSDPTGISENLKSLTVCGTVKGNFQLKSGSKIPVPTDDNRLNLKWKITGVNGVEVRDKAERITVKSGNFCKSFRSSQLHNALANRPIVFGELVAFYEIVSVGQSPDPETVGASAKLVGPIVYDGKGSVTANVEFDFDHPVQPAISLQIMKSQIVNLNR